MNLSDPEIIELNELCSALVDGTITAAQRSRLNQWLAASDDARRFYVRSMALSASLHDYASEMQTDEPAPVANSRIIFGPARWWGIGSIAAAAAVLLALWFAWNAQRDRAEKIVSGAEDEEIVATLSGMTAGTWNGLAPAVGEDLRRGQQLRLVSGIAEITFASGAQIELEGPATIDLHSAWDAVLHRGSLKANVPPEAIGFRISNADVEVTDLGTQFSMVAGEKGGTEVFVIEGAVQAASRPAGQSLTLREQQARRFDRASNNSEVRDREQKLKRFAAKAKLQQLSRPAGYVHWAFDEADGGVAMAEMSGLSTRNSDAQFALSGGGALLLTDGRRQGALAFDGKTSLSAKVPAVMGRDGATLAFWLRIPEDAALPEPSTILAWQRGKNAVAQVSWNQDPAQGALGALRVDTEMGYLVGTTPLRDGRWHHVAVVFGGGGKPRHYLDGRFESVTAKRFKRPHGEAVGITSDLAANTLAIGRGALARADATGFRGAIDELFLTDRALTQFELRLLQRDNRPALPATIADVGR